MKNQRTTLSLKIKHPTRDLSKVCKTLGLHPALLWKAGDERRTPKRNKIGGFRTESYCCVDLGPTTRQSLSKKLEAALVMLKPYRRLLRTVSSTGGRVSFSVGWFCDEHTGESFARQILEQMADLHIALDLYIYPPDK